jgi:hypothetical protein
MGGPYAEWGCGVQGRYRSFVSRVTAEHSTIELQAPFVWIEGTFYQDLETFALSFYRAVVYLKMNSWMAIPISHFAFRILCFNVT